MDSRAGFYILMKDVENPNYSESPSWWQTVSSYVYTQEDDVVELPHLALKGELLEALEPDHQPQDSSKIALRSVKQSCMQIECSRDDLKPLEIGEMKLLLAVDSFYERCQIVDDRSRIIYGCTLEEGAEVNVMIKDLRMKVSGVVRYKGPVPPFYGTMFGIEIMDSKFRRHGNSDGSCQCKRYFRCQPGSGLFVSLDSLTCKQEKQDTISQETSKNGALVKDEIRKESIKNTTIVDSYKNFIHGNNSATFYSKLEPNNEDNEMNTKHKKDNKKNGDRNKVKQDLKGTETKSFVEELQQHLLKVTNELDEMKNEKLEWERKMEQHAVMQNDLRNEILQLQKKLEDATIVKCETEEQFIEEQKRWKKQVKGFNKEWEEFERRLLEERTLRMSVEETLRQIQQLLEQEKSQRALVESELHKIRETISNQAEDFDRQREYFQYRINELENKPHDTGAIATANERPDACDWILSRDEIILSRKSLGTGGWGLVVEGTFRGCPVAVKKIHDLILSPHNKRLFEREMSIASQCRHPCLLQFMGATNDNGNPLFVTELMDTNLRSKLEVETLNKDVIMTISHDVAMALNYLHLNKPLPIIHRDISSANVLLWKRDGCWRAKVSDYGAANFMRQCRTINPGAVIYSAPEALSIHQTPKIDVFSFGLLLCEMSIRELPVPGQTQRQVAMVTNCHLRELISHCIEENHEKRPTMDEVLRELKNNL